MLSILRLEMSCYSQKGRRYLSLLKGRRRDDRPFKKITKAPELYLFDIRTLFGIRTLFIWQQSFIYFASELYLFRHLFGIIFFGSES